MGGMHFSLDGAVAEGGEQRHALRRRERHVIPTHRPLTKGTTELNTGGRVNTSQYGNKRAVIERHAET